MLEGESGRRVVIIVAIVVFGLVFAVVGLAAIGAMYGVPQGSTSSGGGGNGSPGSSGSVNPHIGQVDVDVQTDVGQRNNIGFDVETVFENTATLTVTVSDGEGSAQRSFEGTSTTGTTQEFNDDINPPSTFRDNEQFTITFVLRVDGEIVDQKQFTHEYSE